jgi:hypothetical protein
MLGLRRDSAQLKQLLLARAQDEPISARDALKVFVRKFSVGHAWRRV